MTEGKRRLNAEDEGPPENEGGGFSDSYRQVRTTRRERKKRACRRSSNLYSMHPKKGRDVFLPKLRMTGYFFWKKPTSVFHRALNPRRTSQKGEKSPSPVV